MPTFSFFKKSDSPELYVRIPGDILCNPSVSLNEGFLFVVKGIYYISPQSKEISDRPVYELDLDRCNPLTDIIFME